MYLLIKLPNKFHTNIMINNTRVSRIRNSSNINTINSFMKLINLIINNNMGRTINVICLQCHLQIIKCVINIRMIDKVNSNSIIQLFTIFRIAMFNNLNMKCTRYSFRQINIDTSRHNSMKVMDTNRRHPKINLYNLLNQRAGILSRQFTMTGQVVWD